MARRAPFPAIPRLGGLLLAGCIAFIPAPALAQPGKSGGAGAAPSAAPSAATTPGDGLKPGQFRWTPEASASGPVVVVVSLPEQRAHVYRGGVRIGLSTVSTGMEGHPTPSGQFPILQKKRINYSNLYDNAPMPFMQRLTWDGIALHAGKIPGYPASHGCVRLPKAFAEHLYGVTETGAMVVIADADSYGPEVLAPGERAPVDAYTGLSLPAMAADAAVASAPVPTAEPALPADATAVASLPAEPGN